MLNQLLDLLSGATRAVSRAGIADGVAPESAAGGATESATVVEGSEYVAASLRDADASLRETRPRVRVANRRARTAPTGSRSRHSRE